MSDISNDPFSDFIFRDSNVLQSSFVPLSLPLEDHLDIDMTEMLSLPDPFPLLDAAEFHNIQDNTDSQVYTELPSLAPATTLGGSDHLQISHLGYDAQTLSQTDDTRLEHRDQERPPGSIDRQTFSSQSDDPMLQGYLHEFVANPSTVLSKRKRKQFSPERRKQVEHLRKVGACLRCRLTKSPVRNNVVVNSRLVITFSSVS